MKNLAPFLDVRSFISDEESREGIEHETLIPLSSPFLSVYESEDGFGLINPATEDYVAFLNELYDEEFDKALSTLVDDARAIHETHFPQEAEDPQTVGYQAERLLNQHFTPLLRKLRLVGHDQLPRRF